MPNFTCKKLTRALFDYAFIVAHDYGNDVMGYKNEIKQFLIKTMRKNANCEKTISTLSYLFGDLSGKFGEVKAQILNACFFYGRWTDYQSWERFNCLCVLTFDNYRDILHAITDCGYEFFTTDDIKIQLLKRVKADLSDSTLTDYINQIVCTMVEIGVVKRYKRGLYKLQKCPVFDAVSIYIVLKTFEALDREEDASWFLKCFNFEVGKDFVSFFPAFDYTKLIGGEVYQEFINAETGSLRLSMGAWTYADAEMVYDIGKAKSEIMQNLYVTIDDVKKALNKNVFDGWNTNL